MTITYEDFLKLWDAEEEPKTDQDKLERCVLAVKQQGHSKEQAFAICQASLKEDEGKKDGDYSKKGDQKKPYTMDSIYSDIEIIPANGREVTDEGYLKVDATLARTGIQTYLASQLGSPTGFAPTDLVRVYRPPAEVFRDTSLATFELKPVTNNHPNANSSVTLLDTETVKRFQVGTIGQDVRRDGDLMRATLIITDPRAINDIDNGKVQISNGYQADTVFTPGVTEDGEPYDAIQINIRGNHAALVDIGRCGSECSISDAENLEITDCPGCGGVCSTKNDKIGDKPMSLVKRKIGNFDCEVAESSVTVVDAAITTINQQMADKDSTIADLKTQLDAANKAAETAKGERDSLKTQLADAESKIPNGAQLDSMVAEHADFIHKAKTLDSSVDTNGKAKPVIMKEIITKACPNENFDSASEDYIKARFDGLLAHKQASGSFQLDAALQQSASSQQAPAGGQVFDSEAARQQMLARNNTKASGFK